MVNYRTNALFRECCASLYEHLGVDFELYGVDTSPEDPVAEFRIPNKGYGNAVNYGVSLGTSEHVLILNADTRATMHSNTDHVLELLDQPDVAMVGPKQVNPSGWIASAGCPPAANGVGYTIRGWKELDRGQYADIVDCMYVAGSVVFTKRDVFEELGGFLETPLYYEETFFAYKARHRGMRCVYTGRSQWIHHWDSSPKPDQHLMSNRPVAIESHAMFAAALAAEGVPASQIPPFV